MGNEGWRPELWSQFEDDAAIIYVLDRNLNIAYCNAAWDRFAMENGGASLFRRNQIGCNVVEITPPPLRPFYAKLYARALRGDQDVSCEYECSSGETFRRFHMDLMRKDIPNQGSFLVIVNSLILETARQYPDIHYEFRALCEENGLITMCSHCRRTRIPNGGDHWVWVPDLVRAMPRNVSHGLCPVCFDIHYGQ
jgi:hypothetical protein